MFEGQGQKKIKNRGPQLYVVANHHAGSCYITPGGHFIMFIYHGGEPESLFDVFSSLEMRPRWHFFFSPLEGHFHCIFLPNMGAPWGVSLPECRSDPWKTRRFLSLNLPPLLCRNVWFQLGSQGWVRALSLAWLSLSLHTQYMFVCVTASSSGFRVWGWTIFLTLLFTFSWFVLSSFPRILLRSSWFAARL